jgi:hypothetical protein
MLNFTSQLDQQYKEDLERLLFFNPRQHSVLAAIVDAVEQFGPPALIEQQGYIRVTVEKFDEVQAIFVLDDEILAGVLVYARVSTESLVVIHLAVDQEYSSSGSCADQMLAMRMIGLLRSNARRIKGINDIQILYSGKRIRHFPV